MKNFFVLFLFFPVYLCAQELTMTDTYKEIYVGNAKFANEKCRVVTQMIVYQGFDSKEVKTRFSIEIKTIGDNKCVIDNSGMADLLKICQQLLDNSDKFPKSKSDSIIKHEFDYKIQAHFTISYNGLKNMYFFKVEDDEGDIHRYSFDKDLLINLINSLESALQITNTY